MDNYTLVNRWEQGSEFHLMDYELEDAVNDTPWRDSGLLLGSGRDAIRLLLNYGMAHRGWLRLWIPEYFCQEIAEAILSTGIRVILYNAHPFDACQATNLSLQPGDVVFVVNYFGLTPKPNYTGINFGQIEIIEDHTHDPWSEWAFTSQANWCLASLRKTLPIADGGVLWSPSCLPLPPTALLTEAHKAASLNKLAAMVLKKYYLAGMPIQKNEFRNLAISGENDIGLQDVSSITPWSKEILQTFPIAGWRRKRRKNFHAFVDKAREYEWVNIPDSKEVFCPFSIPLIFDSQGRRDYVREKLIEHSVYPAILWDLSKTVVDGISDPAIDTSQRVLSIHCDMRYDERDMEHIADLVAAIGKQYDQLKTGANKCKQDS